MVTSVLSCMCPLLTSHGSGNLGIDFLDRTFDLESGFSNFSPNPRLGPVITAGRACTSKIDSLSTLSPFSLIIEWMDRKGALLYGSLAAGWDNGGVLFRFHKYWMKVAIAGMLQQIMPTSISSADHTTRPTLPQLGSEVVEEK